MKSIKKNININRGRKVPIKIRKISKNVNQRDYIHLTE